MKKSTKILIITLVIIFILIFILGLIGIIFGIKSVGDKVFGNFFEAQETIKDEKEQYKELGEKNAINYIYQKYNFTPTVISSKAENSSSPVPFGATPNGFVTVELKYNNHNFSVYIDAKSENINGKDNYQYDKIVSDLLDLIYEDIQEKPYSYEIEYATLNQKIGMIDIFYDGNNLYEVLKETGLNIDLFYINSSKIKNLSYVNSSKILDNSTTRIMNFKSYEDYNNRNLDINHSDKIEEITYNAVYLNDAIYYSNGKPQNINLDLFESNGIYVCFENNNNYNTVSLQKIILDDVSGWNGHGFVNSKQASDAYSLSGFNEDDKVYIYIPLSMIKYFNKSNTSTNPDIGVKYNLSYTRPSQDVVGNYLVFDFEIKDSNSTNFEFVALKSEY